MRWTEECTITLFFPSGKLFSEGKPDELIGEVRAGGAHTSSVEKEGTASKEKGHDMPRGKASPSKPDLPKAPPKPRYVKDETINAARDADYTAKSKAYMAAMAAHSKAMDKRDASKKRDARAFWAQEQPNTKVAMRPQSKPPTSTASSSLASPRRSPRHSTALAPSSSSDDRMLDSSSAPGPTALVASTFSDGRIPVRLRPPPKPSPPPSPPPRASVPSSSSITCRQGHAMARRTTIPAYYGGAYARLCVEAAWRCAAPQEPRQGPRTSGLSARNIAAALCARTGRHISSQTHVMQSLSTLFNLEHGCVVVYGMHNQMGTCMFPEVPGASPICTDSRTPI